jgi:hypothetical protein
MDSSELLAQIDRLLKKADMRNLLGVHTEACEFLRVYGGGPKNEYVASLRAVNPRTHDDGYVLQNMSAVLRAFRDYVEAGLLSEVTPERKAQLDVVSDVLEQAHQMLEGKGHPAAPAVLIGAALEEFLRTWVEAEALSLGNAKRGLDAYAKALREADKITKQDYKDITAWTGLRNHAAHGEWAEVADKGRISLMMEGVNLFMRKYGA